MHLRALLVALAATLALAAPAAAQQGTLVVPDDAPVCTGVGDTTTACSNDGTLPPGAEDETVGEGNIITEPADEIGEDVDQAVAAAPERGAMQVERGTRVASSTTAEQSVPAAGGAASKPGASASASADTDSSAAPGEVTTATRAAPAARTLPFTGVDAGPLALVGALMLICGLALRRSLRTAAQQGGGRLP